MSAELPPLVLTALTTLVVLIVAFAAYKVASRGLDVMVRRSALSPQIALLLRRTLFWGILVIATFLVLQSAGILSNVWTVLTAVLGLVAIGFVAVWSVLSNVLCALVLLVTKSYRVGDLIGFPTEGIEGRAVDFNVIFTTLEDTDGGLVKVPNNLFLQKPFRRRPGVDGTELEDQLMRESQASVADGQAAP